MTYPVMRLRVLTRLPARVISGIGIAAELNNGTLSVEQDWSAVNATTPADVSSYKALVLNSTTGAFEQIPAPNLVPPAAWASISGKPSTFPPSSHTHSSSDVSDFNAAVDARVKVGRTYYVPEDFGAIGNGVANDTTALQAFFNNTSKRGRLSAGKTYLVSTITVPAEFVCEAEFGVRPIIIKTGATGTLLALAGNSITLRGFTVDGSHTTDTYAGGYVANHYGIKSDYSVGTPKLDITLDDLVVKNCGDTGIDLRLVTRCKVTRCNVSRCGYAGIAIWSGVYCEASDNIVDNIYPGSGGTAPELNAYGITMSNYSADRRSTYGKMLRNRVSNVLSWNGIDEHNSEWLEIRDNLIWNCAQAIGCQHGIAGQPVKELFITGNVIEGFTNVSTGNGTRVATLTKDSQTYRMTGGIIVVGGVNTDTGNAVTISNNVLRGIGDTRVAAGSSGAIKVQNVRTLVVTLNRLYLSYCIGILLYDDTVDSILYHQVTGNVIDAVTLQNSVQYGIRATSRVLGNCAGNMANASGGISQVGSPTYVTTFSSNVIN